MNDSFPPVVPLGTLTPWGTPGDMPTGPRITQRPRKPKAGELGGPVEIFDAHHYATINGSFVTAVTNAAPGVLVLSQPDSLRNLMLIRNSSATANLYIEFGSQATVASALKLAPDQIALFDTVVPQDDVYALADAAGGQISIQFSNIE